MIYNVSFFSRTEIVQTRESEGARYMKAIEGTPKPIEEVFQYEFEIPEFQRPYSWGKDQCEQLWDDLRSFIDDPDSDKYFLGSIVVYPKEEQSKILCVIDGQQRLTTLLMLIHVFFEKVSDYTILERIIYKTSSETGDIIKGEPRIESKVLLKDDKNSLCEILKDRDQILEKGNSKFKENYQLLKDILEEWWSNKSPKERKKIIAVLLNKIVMLLIRCEDEDDALTLFEIINNRGMPLDDADIFKTKMYRVAKDRNDFIVRWNNMDNHLSLFRSYMHIHRAERRDTSKEIGLRKYFKPYMEEDLSNNLESIMINLEKCNWLEKNKLSDNDGSKLDKREKVYWKILEDYPNDYCFYPLKVFLCKYTNYNTKKDILEFDKTKSAEYIDLIEYTVRYFLFKGLVYNALSSVRDTSFRVCRAIVHGEDFITEYKNNVKPTEKDLFYSKLETSNWGRYGRCLILLNAFLNEKQNIEDYSAFLEGKYSRKQPEIEHILPKKWRNYDGWDKESHAEYLNNIGNLVPLEKEINAGASNEFFSYRKGKYRDSKVRDAVDLSEYDSEQWTKDDIEERQRQVLKRLKKFFNPIYPD